MEIKENDRIFYIATYTTRLENKLNWLFTSQKKRNMILFCPRAIHNKSYFLEFVTTLISVMYNIQKTTMVVVIVEAF